MSLFDGLVRWPLHRPRLIGWLCVWAVVCAALLLRHMPFALLPNLAPAEATIETEAPGFVAEQVEQSITGPIESALVGTPGVDRVQSRSTQGLSIITVRFASDADPGRVRQAIAENLAKVGALPPGAAAPKIAPLASAGAGVLKIGFVSDTLNPMDLRDIVQWTVRPRLLSAPGVGRVQLYGGQVRRIEVRARPGDLSDSDLGFLDILNATRRATSFAGAGFIDTPNQRVLIEPHGQAQTIEQVGAGQIQTPGADPVRIDDVADVVEAPAPAFGDALINGKPGVLLVVDHQFGANTARTTRAVDKALAVLAPSLAAQGVQVVSDLDRPASYIDEAIKGIVTDLAIGLVLAMMGLLLLLHDLRAVMVAMVHIPLTFLAALLALNALGWSLNAMTLGGLAVALGMVADDAVIDVENIVATLRGAEAQHASRLQAILAASLEIRRPVAYAVLPAAVSLAPLLALGGEAGALLAPLACTIIVALLASLAVALTVTPALSFLFLKHIKPAPEHPAFQHAKDRHGAAVRWLAARPWPVLTAATAVVLAAGLATLGFRPEFLPPVQDDQLVIQASAPAATPPQTVRDLGVSLSQTLLATPGVRAVSERIGRDDTSDDAASTEQSLFDVALTPGLAPGGQAQVRRRIAHSLDLYPGLAPRISSRFDAGQAGEGGGEGDDAAFRVGVFGADLDAVDKAAARIAQVVGALPGAGLVRTPDSARSPVVRADLDFSRLALFGLSAADVLDTIQAAFAGEPVAKVYDGPRVVDLAISAQDSLRRDPETVGDLLLRSTSGISEPLKSVANVYLTDGRATITHQNGLRVQWVEADPAARDLARFADAAQRAVASQVALAPGVFVEFDRADAAPATVRRLEIGYALAAFAIFALLAVAFDGWTAAVVMLSSLFAFVGGVVAVALSGGVMSVGAQVGFIALFGLSVRGALLMVSQAEDLVLRRRAAWSLDTLGLAARDRAGALVMTALLVAVVLAPLAVSAGDAGREILGPMAIVIIGGLLTGLAGELFVLPTLLFAAWRPGYGRLAHPTSSGLHTN